MRAARRILFASVALLTVLWAAALTSTSWSERDLLVGFYVILAFAGGHVVALVLAITGVIVGARDLRGAAAARTTTAYMTLAASGIVAAFITVYLGFFVGLWGA